VIILLDHKLIQDSAIDVSELLHSSVCRVVESYAGIRGCEGSVPNSLPVRLRYVEWIITIHASDTRLNINHTPGVDVIMLSSLTLFNWVSTLIVVGL
jgi:hypothetical protein